VDAVLHQLVCSLEELRRYQNDGCGAIANLLVLLLREVDEDAAARIVDVEE
jgi:hypothetical protein